MFDPLYILIILVGFGLSFYASRLTKSRFQKYSQFTTRSRLTGADIARNILSDNNIHDDDVGVISSYFDSDVENQPCQECNNNSFSGGVFPNLDQI